MPTSDEPWLAFRFTAAELEAARAKLFDGSPETKRMEPVLTMPKRTAAKPKLRGKAKRMHQLAVAEQVAIAERTGYAGEMLS